MDPSLYPFKLDPNATAEHQAAFIRNRAEWIRLGRKAERRDRIRDAWQMLCPPAAVAVGASALIATLLYLGAARHSYIEATQPEPVPPSAEQTYYLMAENNLRRQSSLPDAVQVKDLRLRTDAGSPVICGEVNVRSPRGGFTGFEPFLYYPIDNRSLRLRGTAEAEAVFIQLWRHYNCGGSAG